uniref:Uncharacterized protein n=1 Tax=Rhizophora mucronata TaxID=61149 RepID=A0A2P2PQ98_RHIMU
MRQNVLNPGYTSFLGIRHNKFIYWRSYNNSTETKT